MAKFRCQYLIKRSVEDASGRVRKSGSLRCSRLAGEGSHYCEMHQRYEQAYHRQQPPLLPYESVEGPDITTVTLDIREGDSRVFVRRGTKFPGSLAPTNQA